MSKIPDILQDIYIKNLKFFEKQNPSIFHVLSNITPDHSKIIITEEGLIDLVYKNKRIYNGDAINYAESEVSEFNDIHKGEVRKTASIAATPNSYNAERFFHRHLNKTISEIHENIEFKKMNVIYTDKRHDLLIMTGIGLGLHITELLEKTEIQNLVILETDFELLALSCFFTDWEKIYKIQDKNKSKSITILLINDQELENEQGILWNQLIKRSPHFPYNTVFYNHGRHDKYGKIIRNIQNDTQMYLNLWGFYDDESNQLNHIIHNINNEIKLIPKRNDFKWSKPVIVCGSGPSLDERIHQLKSIRESSILITAGTSLLAVLKYDLIPDFHLELESDYNVFTLLENLDKNILKEINLICALQCSPYVTRLFKNSYGFIKDSMAIGDILEKNEDKLLDCTPTCVNAALSIALHYSSKRTYLFGTDFGFYDNNKHHSKNSIYNSIEIENENISELKNETNKFMSNNFEKEGYLGKCLTTSVYFTTKRRIEILISSYKAHREYEIFNLSDGLIISNTKHINQDKEINESKESEDDIKIFNNKSRHIEKDTIKKINNTLYPAINELCEILINNLENLKSNKKDLSALTWAISNYIDTTFKSKNGSLIYFIRGTLWHYMLAGYSLSYAKDNKESRKVIAIWKKRFIDFLKELPIELKKMLDKKRETIEDDPQLTATIKDSID